MSTKENGVIKRILEEKSYILLLITLLMLPTVLINVEISGVLGYLGVFLYCVALIKLALMLKKYPKQILYFPIFLAILMISGIYITSNRMAIHYSINIKIVTIMVAVTMVICMLRVCKLGVSENTKASMQIIMKFYSVYLAGMVLIIYMLRITIDGEEDIKDKISEKRSVDCIYVNTGALGGGYHVLEYYNLVDIDNIIKIRIRTDFKSVDYIG